MSATPLRPAAAAWLVARREMTMRLRSLAFVISTVVLMVIVLATVIVGGIAGAHPSRTHVAATGTAIAVAERAPGLDVRETDTVAEAKRLVKTGAVEAAVIPASGRPLGVAIVAGTEAPTAVLSALSVSPDVRLLDAHAKNPFLAYLVSIAFGIVFFLSAITFGSTIAQSVVEEKQTRVVEILLAAVPVRVLLAGKILGNSILAFAQIAIMAALAGGGLLISGQRALLAEAGPSILWFVGFFVVGFVLLAALFAAAASLVSRQEDVASVTSPVTMLVMIPYFLVIFFNGNPVVLGIMSYVPFSAPIGMPARIFLGTAQWWEPLVALAVLLATVVLVVALASRIYSNALLRTGTRVRLAEALRR